MPTNEGEMSKEPLTIVCWKWLPEHKSKHPEKRAAFSCEHVNRLYRMLERNLTRPFELVCVTDNRCGLDSAVRTLNIDRHFGEYKELGGCYRRLKAFSQMPALVCFGKSFVSMDIDVVITGNLDELLVWDEFRIWEDKWRRRTPYCGSLWAMKAGAREKVWEEFKTDPGKAVQKAAGMKYIGTDQAHVSACLWPGEQVWSIRDGVYNFNTQVRRSRSRIVIDGDGNKKLDIGRPGELPEDAKIVFFNGKYDPSQVWLQKKYDWIGDLWR